MISVTHESIIEAYTITGLKPVSDIWIEDDCACPIAALLIAKYGREQGLRHLDTINSVSLYAAEAIIKDLFGADYIFWSFMYGWDGNGRRGDEYFMLGRALREELLP